MSKKELMMSKFVKIVSLAVYAIGFSGMALAQDFPLGDAARGEELYEECAGCHEIGREAENSVGPVLNGIFDRKAGTVEGFEYSQPMMRASANGLVWTLASLHSFIEDPWILVSETLMGFGGLDDAQERADIIAYLQIFSADPSDIPEATPRVQGSDHELDPAILAIVGDPAYGEYLAGECSGCHQLNGVSKGIPSITNWPTDHFVTALHAYKSGRRIHPVMQMMAQRLTEDEIAALAAYYQDLD